MTTGVDSLDLVPPIDDYALLSDCHSVALVSSGGSIDWYCTPRIDSPPVFGALLDQDRGGRCTMAPIADVTEVKRRYLDRTMVLETVFHTESGTLRVRDLMAMHVGGRERPRRQLIRQATCLDGQIELRCEVAPRFDFGMVPPWLKRIGDGSLTAVGGSGGLAIWFDRHLEISDRHDAVADITLARGDECTLALTSERPEFLDEGLPEAIDRDTVDDRVAETIDWWRRWCSNREGGDIESTSLRSALVLKSLVHAPTGAIAAAATTSLPEILGGNWNWDYRYSWVRDSWLSVRSLAEAGFAEEADGFHRFIERSSAGNARDLSVMYGVDGRHRIPEIELPDVEGYQGARPVRVGNVAHGQLQHDMYGYLVGLAWHRVQHGATLDESQWGFIVDVIDTISECWHEPDHGIWELRGEPRHYIYSKVLCWTALDRGLALADRLGNDVDAERWRSSRDDLRSWIETNGIAEEGHFVETAGGGDIDAALLLLPEFGFVSGTDQRMEATVDAVIGRLDDGGLIRRFCHGDRTEDEGTFVACTFWLVERLVDLGRHDEAHAYFDRGCSTSNDVGLFAEQYDTRGNHMLGNFPQALSHLAHLGAAHALGVDAER